MQSFIALAVVELNPHRELKCSHVSCTFFSRYGFWNYPFTRCASEIEKVFESVARSCMPPSSGAQRTE